MLNWLLQKIWPTRSAPIGVVARVYQEPPFELQHPYFMRAAARNPHWSTVRAHFLTDHTACAACGSTEDLQVHHVRPFHLHPELELDPRNLIVLCESPTRLCHFRCGHSYDWHAFNPHVRTDAEIDLSRVKQRRYA